MELESVRVQGAGVLKPVDEAGFASVNAFAQYGLVR